MFTATSKRVFLPKRGHFAHFHDRQKMKAGHPSRSFKAPAGGLPTPTLPIDWTKGNTLSFPMDGNDTYGDCMEAAAAHADNTFTGNAGTESQLAESALVQQYLAASGGDNGLDEQTLLNSCWKPGLGGVAAATYLDALDIDPTNAQLMQAAVNLFGGSLFMLDVPDAWVQNFDTGAVWDAPATADQNNGHGVWWNGVDENGNYNVITWGSHCWITPAGVKVCDPSAFIVFSLRWFNSQGIAPNGMSYAQLAALWVQCGGNALPPNPFPAPAPTPPAPTPTPQPTPVSVIMGLIDGAFAQAIQDAAGNSLEVLVLQTLQHFIDAELPPFLTAGEGALWQFVLARLQAKAASDPFLALVKDSVMKRVRRGLGKRALPPGTLLTWLQTLLQDAPEIISVVEEIIQGIQGGNAAA